MKRILLIMTFLLLIVGCNKVNYEEEHEKFLELSKDVPKISDKPSLSCFSYRLSSELYEYLELTKKRDEECKKFFRAFNEINFPEPFLPTIYDYKQNLEKLIQ